MRKQILIFIITFLSISTMAQNDFHRWQIGASFSPDALGYLPGDDYHGKFNFTTGLNTVYKFTNSFGIETGVFFSNIRFRYVRGSDVPAAHYTFRYINVPLRANYYFGKGEVRGLTTLGAVANFRQYASLKYNSKWQGQWHEEMLDITEKINFSTLIGIGMECKLSDRFTLRAIPIVRLGLKENFAYYYSRTLEKNLWSLGAEIGVFYRIK